MTRPESIRDAVLRAADTNAAAAAATRTGEFEIDPAFKDLLPAQSADERARLEASLVAEGCREPLVVGAIGDRRVLVDGHNRLEICRAHELKYDIVAREFATIEEAKVWAFGTQLARRNLSAEQAAYARGSRYLLEKDHMRIPALPTGRDPAGEPKAAGGRGGQSDHRVKTSERLAGELGVGEKTIRRDAEFARQLDLLSRDDPRFRELVLRRGGRLSRADVKHLAGLPAAEHLKLVAEIVRDPGRAQEVLHPERKGATVRKPTKKLPEKPEIFKELRDLNDGLQLTREGVERFKLVALGWEMGPGPDTECVRPTLVKLIARLEEALERIEMEVVPYKVCPACKGSGADCRDCASTGWFSRKEWK